MHAKVQRHIPVDLGSTCCADRRMIDRSGKVKQELAVSVLELTIPAILTIHTTAILALCVPGLAILEMAVSKNKFAQKVI